MTDTDLERRLLAMRSESLQHQIDPDRGWRDLRVRRSRDRRNRRRGLAAVAAAVAVGAVTIALPTLAGRLPAAPSAVPSAVRSGTGPVTAPASGGGAAPAAITYPRAIAARIPLANANAVVEDRGRAWTLTQSRTGSYQLVRIDLRTNKVSLRVSVGPNVGDLTAGGGTVWLGTTLGRAQGQVLRINPATGGVIATLHLPAGRCPMVAYSAGQLWATCSGGGGTDLLRINPATGRVDGRAGPVRGPIVPVIIGPEGMWYVTGSRISGLVGLGSRARVITVGGSALPSGLAPAVGSVVFDQGALWAFTADESVAKIDPATGRIVRVYPYSSYDPQFLNGQDFFLGVGQSSLWFLDVGLPSSGVLRVSLATGRPLGWVPRLDSCNEPCSQIYVTQSAVWVSTLDTLVRIDPARLPG
jgi:hypothetical protein